MDQISLLKQDIQIKPVTPEKKKEQSFENFMN